MRARLAILLTLAFACASQAHSVPRYPFGVRESGHGAPVILIPGLGCGPGVWDTTVAKLKANYHCYVLALPGFAGEPTIPPPYLQTVHDGILKFIQDRKLSKISVIGHSLGGTMAIWLAADAPGLIKAVVSVDGSPYLGNLYNPNEPDGQVSREAAGMRTMFSHMSAAKFAEVERQSLATMIGDPSARSKVLAEVAKSDPTAVGEAAYELYLLDLTPKLKAIRAKMLVYVSEKEYGPGLGQLTVDRFKSQLKDVRVLYVLPAPKARHFVMLDDFALYWPVLKGFLQ